MTAVQGDVNSGQTDTGTGPVKVGGKYNATQPTFADGNRGDAQLDTRGNLKTTLLGANSVNAISTTGTADGIGSGVPLSTAAFAMLWNGTTWDRQRSATIGDSVAATGLPLAATALWNGTTYYQARGQVDSIAAVASAAYTTTQTQADQVNVNHRGLIAVLDMTVVGTGSVTLEIDARDPVSGKYYAMLTGAAVITNSTNVYRVYPGLTAAANATANDVLPKTWRIKVTANNANSATYSVGVMLLV